MSVLYEYPVSIPVYPIRLDNYTNLPVRTGLIHHTFEAHKDYLYPIHFILNKLTDIGDSVFFLGGQDPFLPWNFPFLHFHPAPSVMTNHVPWPWPEGCQVRVRRL